MIQNNRSLSDQRKAENRTKIQLGGLIIKAGLAQHCGIKPGDDLQFDQMVLDKATVLLGALLDTVARVQQDDSLNELWRILGEQKFQKDYIVDKYFRE